MSAPARAIRRRTKRGIASFFGRLLGGMSRGRPLEGDPKTILVLRIDERVGNVLLTTPLLAALRAAFPNARIDALLAASKRTLVEDTVKVIAFEKRDLFRRPWAFVAQMWSLRRRAYDVVIDASHWHHFSSTSALLLAWTAGKVRIIHERGDAAHFATHPIAPPQGVEPEIRTKLRLLAPLTTTAPTPSMSTPLGRTGPAADRMTAWIAVNATPPSTASNPSTAPTSASAPNPSTAATAAESAASTHASTPANAPRSRNAPNPANGPLATSAPNPSSAATASESAASTHASIPANAPRPSNAPNPSNARALLVGLAPGARKPDHRVDPTVFARLGRHARRLGATPIVLWGPGEEPLARQVAEAGEALMAPPTDLEELAALMRQCAVVVTNDTGPMHLAVACGAPTIALFLRAEPGRWGHTEPPNFVLACDELDPDRIVDAAARALEERLTRPHAP